MFSEVSKLVTGVAVPACVLPLPCCPLLQVSKLTTVLLRACRTAAGCSSWDPLVAGVAVGKLVELEELDPLVLAGEKTLPPHTLLFSHAHKLKALAGCARQQISQHTHKRKPRAARPAACQQKHPQTNSTGIATESRRPGLQNC